MQPRVLIVGIFFIFFSACHSDLNEQKEFDHAVALFEQEQYEQAIDLLLKLQGTSVDQVLLGNYLAQSYLESAGFNVIEILNSVASLNHEAREDEYIATVSYLIDILPKADLQVREKFNKAARVFDDHALFDFNDPLIFSYRILYKSILLIYLVKNIGEEVQDIYLRGSLREKFEHLEQIRKSEAIMQIEATIFDIVELMPHLSRKIKKIVKKFLKGGVFRFRFDGKTFTLDFTNREDGGIAQLLIDFFEAQFQKLALEHGFKPSDYEGAAEELKQLAHDLIFGSKSVDDLIEQARTNEYFSEVEEKFFTSKKQYADELADIKKDVDNLDPESYLDKDFNELQSEIEEKADELSNVNIEDEFVAEFEEEIPEETEIEDDLEEIVEKDSDTPEGAEDFEGIEDLEDELI